MAGRTPPILTLSGQNAPKLSKEELDRIRSYVEAGGILFTNSDGDSAEFDKFAHKLCKDLFGQELSPLPADHPILKAETVYNVKPAPQLQAYSNGARLYMLHSPRDISRWWQQRDDKKHKAEFDLGVNLFVYAAGKKDLRNRLESAWVDAPPADAAPLATVKVARLQYAGNWNPEPAAWTRFGNWFQRQTSYKLDVSAVKVSDLKPGDAPVAVLTGTAKQNFAPDAVAAVKAYVEGGGVLLIDTAGGSGAFDAERPRPAPRRPSRRARPRRSPDPPAPARRHAPGLTTCPNAASASSSPPASARPAHRWPACPPARDTSSSPPSTTPAACSAPKPAASSATSPATRRPWSRMQSSGRWTGSTRSDAEASQESPALRGPKLRNPFRRSPHAESEPQRARTATGLRSAAHITFILYSRPFVPSRLRGEESSRRGGN